MLIAIDIDGTIAGYIDWTVDGAIETFVTQYCPEGGLHIPAEKFKHLVDGRSLFQLSEVIAYRQIHEARWQKMLGEFRRSLYGMKIVHALPDAVKGVEQLAKLGTVCYYTVRQDKRCEQKDCNIETVTQQWLARKQFPNPHQVVFCQNLRQKLVKLYEQEQESQLVLIDDRWRQLLEAFSLLEAQSHEMAHIAQTLRQRLTLVAFGAEVIQQSADICLLALPHWSQVASLGALLKPESVC